MSKGNNKRAKRSHFKDAVTGKTYTRMPDHSNAKALKAAAAYVLAHPRKEFYA